MPAGNPSSSQRPTGSASALWLVFGPTVWAIHFMLLYGGHTLLCAVGGADRTGAVRLLVIAATLVALGVLALPVRRALSSRLRTPTSSEGAAVSAFLRRTTAWLIILSALAVLWAGTTAVIVAPCG